MRHTISHHCRTPGWEVGDLYRLLPGQDEEGSWLSNFLLNKTSNNMVAGVLELYLM